MKSRWRKLDEASFLLKKEEIPIELLEIKISEANDRELKEISKELGLALSLEDMKRCKKYFEKLERNPTDIELQTIGQTWSEHCHHRTFRGNIEIENERVNLFEDYIKKTTKDISPSWCVSVFKDNAGIVEFDENRSIAAKVETHNHPSAIEPFGGAATGMGGVIRDILGVWGRPIANTDVLCFGPPDYDEKKLATGTKHPKFLLRGVTDGIGHYGNNMGIPTVNGAICFDDGYVGNMAVYCGCIGTLPTKSYIDATEPGDIAVLAGGKTGKDGIHGVTFASVELTEESEEESRPAVQIANPIEEEKLRRAIIEIRDRGLGKAITDLGGGGLSSAVGETAYDANCGIEINLDKVPLKRSDMEPWEIWISESQERMFLTVGKEELQDVLEVFGKEEVEATPIGRFTEEKKLKVFYEGRRTTDMNLEFLFTPPKITLKTRKRERNLREVKLREPDDLGEILVKLLASPDISSKESIIRTYDHEVQGNTALKPLQGKFSGPNDASIIKPFEDTWKGIVISSGIKPRYGKIDSYWMAASSIEEAIRNNTAVGGRRISLLDNFTWGSPEKEEQLRKLVDACKACYDFATFFETPFISGKDSLYNESPLGSITSTLLITAIGIIPDIRKATSMEVKEENNPIYLIGETYPELGGSEYYSHFDYLGRKVPKVRKEDMKKKMEGITKAMDKGYISACHDVSEGGLGIAACEMAIGGDLGIKLELENVTTSLNRDDFILFSETNGRFLAEVPRRKSGKFEELMKNCDISKVGRVTVKDFSVTGSEGNEIINRDLTGLRTAWKGGLKLE